MPTEPAGSTPDGNAGSDEDIVFSSAEETQRTSQVDEDGNILIRTEGDAPSLTGDSQERTPEQEASEEGKASDDEPPEFANALKKAGGDKAALGRQFWEAQSRAAEATRRATAAEAELERLKSGKGGPPAEQPDEEDEDSEDLNADLKWHTEGIASAQAELKQHVADQAALSNQIIPKLLMEITKAETRLEFIEEDSPKRPAAVAARDSAIARHNEKVREWHDLKKDINTSERSIRELERGKQRIERETVRQQKTKEQAKQEVQQFKDEQSRTYGSLVEEAFAASDLDEEEHGDRFRSMIKRQVTGVLTEIIERHGPNAPAVDLRKLVMSEAEALTSLMQSGRARAATEESKRKAKTNAALRGGNGAPVRTATAQPRVAGQPATDRQPAPQRYVSPEEEARIAKLEARRALGLRT